VAFVVVSFVPELVVADDNANSEQHYVMFFWTLVYQTNLEKIFYWINSSEGGPKGALQNQLH
jgi:hypothetical protein